MKTVGLIIEDKKETGMKKADIIEKLTEKGIEFDKSEKKEVLMELLESSEVPEEVEQEQEEKKND